MRFDPRALTDRPLAAPGLLSYRYPSRFGWVMIGALDPAGALREAARSLEGGSADPGRLEAWDQREGRYVPVAEPSDRSGTERGRRIGGTLSLWGRERREGEAPKGAQQCFNTPADGAGLPHERTGR